MKTADRIVDAASLRVQMLHVQETFKALARAAKLVADAAEKQERKSVGALMQGRQTMLFESMAEASMRLDTDKADLLIEALDAALALYNPGDDMTAHLPDDQKEED